MKKKIKHIIITALSVIFMSGCDYLDIVPDDTATLADAFKNENTAEAFVFSCYGYLPNYQHYRNNFSWVMSNEFSGAYHWGTQYFTFLQIQQGLYSAANPVLDIWRTTYQGIRQCYTFLNNIDDVTPISMSQSSFDSAKKVWKAEVHFLIAYYHFILLQYYGPVCLVEDVISLGAPEEEFYLKRSPYDECVEKIAGWFDEAMVDLPARVSASDYGRATQVVAQAFKSKMYLMAASPLYNGNSEYFADFVDHDGVHLISQVHDKEKWKKAMEETEKAITMAESNGFSLYKYVTTKPLSDFDQAVANARYTMIDRWNSELIWGYSGFKETTSTATESFQLASIPNGFRAGASPPFGCLSPTLTAVETFYTKNGIPADKDPSFDWNNRFKIESGDSTIILHRNREPRFYAFIGYDRGPYEINGDTVTLKLRFGETHGCKNLSVDHLYSGYAVKKGINTENKVTPTTFSIESYPFPLMRLAELYLNYAEACAEYTGSLDTKATQYVNAVRSKAGIPTLAESFGTITGSNLIDVIHREKMIEFMFEGHWLPDLKRWKLAEDFFAPHSEGMRGLCSVGATPETFYQNYKLTGRPLIFTRKQHLHPINNTDINVNHNLVQNPGW